MNAPDRPAGSRRCAGILAGLAIALSPCRPLLCTALLAAAAAPLAAQEAGTGTISGRVQHKVTGDSLNNAIISLKGTNRTTATDSGGYYQLTGVPAGTATIEVSFAGLDTQAATVTVSAGLAAQQDFQLTSGRYADAVALDPFTVRSTRITDASAISVNEQRVAPNITSVVSTDEFGTTVDKNPGEFLKWLPGVDVETFANNIVGVSVRGLGSVNTEISFDGMPVASMNAEGVGRSFEVQYSSAADVAYVEIRKLPLPQDSSNALGGSINMVRRTAFEFNQRKIDYQVLMSGDGEEFSGKIDGPKDTQRQRFRPNWEVRWTEPVSKNFGFALTIGQNNTIANTHWSIPGWSFGANAANAAANTAIAAAAIAAGQPVPTITSLYNPGAVNALNHNAPLMQGKDYGTARLDWRPRPELTLSYVLSYTGGWKEVADDIRYTWNVAQTGAGDQTRYNDANTTLGRIGGGGIYHNSPLWRDVDAPTIINVAKATWKKGLWEAGAAAAWSKSSYTYHDTDHGFFNSTSVGDVGGLANIGHTGVGAATANPISLTVNMSNIDYWGPKTIQAFTTATGAASTNIADYNVPVDWQKNSVIRIGGARSRPGTGKEIVTAGKIYVKREFALTNPLTVRLGLDYTEKFRNRLYDYLAWRFVGADGVANSADDSATLIAAENVFGRTDSVYGYPGAERISMTKLYDLYKAHPTWFQYDENRSVRLSATSNAAYDLTETIVAPYLQFDWPLMNNRLRLAGGVRFEDNSAEARGLLVDNGAAYQKYSDGTVRRAGDVLGANGLPTSRAGNPVFLPGVTANSLEQARLIYKPKGASAESGYENFFPSLHATYNFNSKLVMQVGYARTQAANRFDRSVIPNDDINDTPQTSGALGRISLRNANLKPWIGDNYEARVSYYNSTGGVLGLGAFHKRISDYQVTLTTAPLTAAELAEFGYGPEYTGYEVNSMFNNGTATVQGLELEFRQSLDRWLPGSLKGFSAWGTAAVTKLKGQPAGGDFNGLRDDRYTLNLMYRARKLSANVGYIMNGRNVTNGAFASNGFTGVQYNRPQHMVDAKIEYSINKWARVFLSGQNLLDELRARIDEFDGRPAVQSMGQSNTFGITYTIGITGSF
jgi:iron complex outermembrane receptor protein